MSKMVRRHKRGLEALTQRQRVLISEYATNGWNATKAAIKAGYSKRSAHVVGTQTLKYPRVQQALREELEGMVLGKEQIKARLSEMANGDVTKCFNVNGSLNWKEIRKHGYLVKRLKDGEVEFYDAQDALVHLAKISGLYAERVEVGGEGGGPVRHVMAVQLTAAELPKLKQAQATHSNGEAQKTLSDGNDQTTEPQAQEGQAASEGGAEPV